MSTFTEYAASGVYVCDPEPPADGGRTLNDNFRALVDRGDAVAADLSAHEAATAAHGATSGNTAGRIVARDAGGGFSAGTVSAANVYMGGNGVLAWAPYVCVTENYGLYVTSLGGVWPVQVQRSLLVGYKAGGVDYGTGNVLASGRIGVGTASPAEPLDVVGTAKATRFVGDGVTPVGTVTAFAGSSAPTGWIVCDGADVSRTTYAELFALIGINYGSGDGSTTFNLPNLTGSTLVGVGYVIKA